ncbi:MAG: DUF1566 domain-containing protein [Bacteroidota bacterium]
MKKICLLIMILGCISVISFGQVVIKSNNNKPDTLSGLDMKSTNNGLLSPKMNTAKRDAIISPATGLLIFNTDCNDIQLYNGAAWVPVGNAGTVASPGSISGNARPCMNAFGETYSIAALSGAIGYTWKVPPGATITDGQGTNSITVNFGTSNGAVFVSAYGKCWRSLGSYLGINLLPLPANPVAGIHAPFQNQIIWNWNTVRGATGYKFNTVKDYSAATDLGTAVAKTETGLTSNTSYTRYVWAYFACGNSSATIINQSTLPPTLPTVTTIAVSNLTSTTATIQGNVTSDGGALLTVRGVCWSLHDNPTTAGSKTVHGSATGIFSRNLKNLTPNTIYYVRTYATNSAGTAYGNEMIFTTACASYTIVSSSITASANPICSGTPATFTAIPVNGGTNPSYQWKVNGTNISGATNAAYTYIPATNNVVTCLLTSNAQCVNGNPATSNPLTMKVFPLIPIGVSIVASANSVCAGSRVTYTATPSNGGSSPAYLWKVNGRNVSGATNANYSYIPANNDVVTCLLNSNAECLNGNPATSNAVTMIVNPVLPVGDSIVSSANPFAPGSPVTFTSTSVNGGSSPVYQWLINGVNVGTNSASYSYIPWNGDNVICIVTSSRACVTSNPALSNSMIMVANPNYPTVTTSALSNITQNSATSGGGVISDGGSSVIFRDICIGTNPNPTVANNSTTNGTGLGQFVSNLTGLTTNTLYYLRAYAVNSIGTAYGYEFTFVTLPTITTTAVANITQTSAKSGGNVTPGGGANVTSRGVCWSVTSKPTIMGSHSADGTGTGVFTSNMIGLAGNTLFYVRAYATNGSGTVYGDEQTFTTSPVLPTITTDPAIYITLNTAKSGGKITSDGGANISARGVCWSTSPDPTIANSKTINGTGTGMFVNNLDSLNANTQYYLRSYATNSVGTVYGNEINFTTLLHPILPSVTTSPIANLTATTANSGGVVVSDGGAMITLSGVCWGTSPNPTLANSYTTDGSRTGEFLSTLTNLNPTTHFYFRAYAVNSVGTAFGNEMEINKYLIGQSFGGGLIFYIDGTGQHGLICAATDQSNNAQWGCNGIALGSEPTAIGVGQFNTSTIVNRCIAADIAARQCNDLVLNGYDDWFLPSKDELNQIYLQKTVIGSFSGNNYWSSSEYDSNYSWYQSFYDGYQYYYDKFITTYVRAVRSF